MIGLLMLAAAATGAAPDDPAFAEQARRCGVTSDHVVWSTDDQGKPVPSLTPHGDLKYFSVRSIKCLLDWALANGRRVGFISEPTPKKP